MAGTWLNISLADDLAAILAREPADAVVIDCMLAGVLARSAEFGAPAAVLVPGLYHSVLPVRDAMLAAGLGLLARAGLPAPDPAAMRWENKDLVPVTSLHELDGVTADLAPNVRYVGPAFAWPPAPRGWRSPADHRRTHRSARRRHHRILPGTGTRTPRRRRACAGHPVLPAGRTPARPDHRPARRSRRRRLSPAGLRGTARGRPAPGDHHNAGDRTDAKSLKP